MAPASRSGYALLPTSDLAEAGGSVRPSAPVRIELPKVSPFSQARGQPDEGSGTAAVDASAKLGEVVGGLAWECPWWGQLRSSVGRAGCALVWPARLPQFWPKVAGSGLGRPYDCLARMLGAEAKFRASRPMRRIG